jgi:tetratricopeptide (TPR) repeat protein
MTRIMFLLLVLCTSVTALAQPAQQDKLRLARTYEQAGDLKNAARLYQELWSSRPEVDIYFEGVVRTLIGLQQYPAVMPIIEQRVKEQPDDQLLILAGMVGWRVGRTTDATAWWKEALRASPLKERTAMEIAQTQVSLGLTDMAIKYYLIARNESGMPTTYAAELSSLYAARGNSTKATDEIMIYLTSSGDVSGAQGRLAAVMMDSSTRVYIGEVLKNADGENVSILRLRQWYHREIKDLGAALDDTKELDERLRANGNEILTFADAMRREGNYDIALSSFGELMKRSTADATLLAATFGYTRTLQQRASAKSGRLQRSEALEIMERYSDFIAKAPNHPYASDALLQMARISDQDLNDLPAASDRLTQLTNRYRGTPAAADGALYAAELWVVKGQLDAAARTLEDLMRLTVPTVAQQREVAKVRRADLYRYTGALDSARMLYLEVSAVPGSDAANDAFEALMLLQLADQDSAALVLYDQAELLELQRRSQDAAVRYGESAARATSPELKDRCGIASAENFVEAGKTDDAEKALQPVLLRVPESIVGDRALLIHASIEESRGQRTAAIATLTTILTQYPRSIYGPMVRERIRVLRGDV